MENTWLARYTLPMEIINDWESEFLGHKFKNNLIRHDYRIKYRSISPGNTKSNAILEITNHVLGNVVWTYTRFHLLSSLFLFSPQN